MSETLYRKVKRPSKARTGARGFAGATVLLLLEAIVLFASPNISLAGGFMNITNGLLAFGFVLGAFFWGLIEIYTGPGEKTWDLIWRWVTGVLAGLIIGGIVGYVTGFGPNVILPASEGNALAFVTELAFLWVSACFAYAAAWWHSRGVVA